MRLLRSSLRRMIPCVALACSLFVSGNQCNAGVIGFADVVLDYYDSGAGSMAGPYGGLGGSFPVAVPTSVVLGNTPTTFLSLPTGSFVVVGFTDETVIDGVGNDIFIREIGNGLELADIYVRSGSGPFVLLGQANGNTVTSFDLSSISFTSPVTSLKVVGLDNGGGSPGFDLASVEVLPGSTGPMVPEPTSLAIFAIGSVGLLTHRRRRAS